MMVVSFQEGKDWAEEAMDNRDFRRSLHAWRGLNALRFAIATLAWILSCVVRVVAFVTIFFCKCDELICFAAFVVRFTR